jgi:hypothetical protein
MSGEQQDYFTDEDHQVVQRFSEEFKALVRKYMPLYPSTQRQSVFLANMQDKTSLYSPWIWSDSDED